MAVGCHYFLITEQITPCHHWKQHQAAAYEKICLFKRNNLPIRFNHSLTEGAGNHLRFVLICSLFFCQTWCCFQWWHQAIGQTSLFWSCLPKGHGCRSLVVCCKMQLHKTKPSCHVLFIEKRPSPDVPHKPYLFSNLCNCPVMNF